MNNKISTFCLLVLIILMSGCDRDSETVTIESLLGEMTDRSSITCFPDIQFTHRQFSSYNRASVSPDSSGWFANADMSHFLRVEENRGRKEYVMFDADGPGAVVRWWMTFYKAQNGTIRVYIDNDTVPVLKGAPRDLLSGDILAGYPLTASVQEGAPLGEEGRDYDHNFYLPVPFSRHCKITYECDSLRLLYDYKGIPVPKGYYSSDVFYNIGYRLYQHDTEVESASAKRYDEIRYLIDKTCNILLENKVNPGRKVDFAKVIPAGDSMSVVITEKQYAVNYLTVEIQPDSINQSLRSTVLRISFDGNQTVWVPAGEFFGVGYVAAPHRTMMNSMNENGVMESFWLMPFKKSCEITFINYGRNSVDVKGSAGLEPFTWKDNCMYFGSSWHEYNNIMTRDEKNSPFDLNFIDIKGKGIYVGDQVTLFNNTYKWWGEGDEKIFVDGESFPSSFGTGSEDYYGYSFGRQESFSHPFLSQPVGIGNMSWGVVVNMRHRLLDAIPFAKSISSNIELWHWADIRMNYALTTYYYIKPPYEINIKPDIESVRHRVIVTRNDFTLDEK